MNWTHRSGAASSASPTATRRRERYLMGAENDIDTVGAAIEALRGLQAKNPDAADVAYDLARVLSERGRPATAAQAWRRFLELEPSGSYAAEAARWLPEPPPAAPAGRRAVGCS